MSDNNVTFDRPKLERLKTALAEAPGDRDAVFQFEGNEYVKSYAKYLIEYLERKLP